MAERDSYYQRVSHYSPARVAPFNAANKRLPRARETERRLLIERLDLQPGLTVLDTGAGGGYLGEGILEALHGCGMVIGMDAAEHFVALLPDLVIKLVCGMDAFPLADESTDRVSNLAGLHHVEHKAGFFAEAYRILKPGGLVGVADVRRDTPPARWLNGPVDRMTDIGHDGMFVAEGEFSRLLANAGFVYVEECHERYAWRFPHCAAVFDYARDLFRLGDVCAAEIERALGEHLRLSADADGVGLAWELTYATGRKPAP